MTHDQQPMTRFLLIGPYLIVGLGNPGAAYAANRHNAGFMVLDRIMGDYGFGRPLRKFGGGLAEGIIGTAKTYAFAPLGYMNTSGGPVSEIVNFYKIPLENIIVIHDELDVPLGKLKVKCGGGNGGHNGLRSLDAHIGADYRRVRFGISHPGDKNRVSDYVLSDFAKDEWPVVELLVSEISKNIPLLLQGDDAGFMNKVALATKEQ